MDDLRLVFCSSADVVEFEMRHYVRKLNGKPRGHHGQQVHFLIMYKGENVGCISGGSAVFATRMRDDFFGLNKNNRTQTINGIIDNTLFRLENHEPNLATRVLSRWRRSVVDYWEYLYDVTPYGFETFVDQKGDDSVAGKTLAENGDLLERPGMQRVGCLYLADNWTFLGKTCGSTKNHIGVGLTGSPKWGGKGAFARETVTPKLVFCKWIRGFDEPQYCEYKSSWKAGTKIVNSDGSITLVGTPEEAALAKERTARRKRCMGTSSLSEIKV